MVEKINVAEELDRLIRLQEIDEQIYRLRSEKEAKPGEITRLRDSASQSQSGLRGAEDNLKALQLKRKEKEAELADRESDINKLQSQLYQIKTNKEYTAMLHEIESKKADNSLLEDDIIKLMDTIDDARSKVNEEKKRFEEESKKAEEEVKKIEANVSEIEAALSELKKKRDEISSTVDAASLRKYEKILAGKNGYALADVVNDACSGCHIELPPQVINEIKMKEDIIYCENCQRMLYINE